MKFLAVVGISLDPHFRCTTLEPEKLQKTCAMRSSTSSYLKR